MDIIACTAAAGNSEIPLHGKQGTESKERTESAEILFFFIHTHTSAARRGGNWLVSGRSRPHNRTNYTTGLKPQNAFGIHIEKENNLKKKKKMHQTL